MMHLRLFAMGAAMVLAACSTNKILTPTGGSRSDGTVEMSYQYGAFERPVIDFNSARVAAEQKCRAWGYSSAEPFGGERRQCQAPDPNIGCAAWFVSMTYQCTGAASPQ